MRRVWRCNTSASSLGESEHQKSRSPLMGAGRVTVLSLMILLVRTTHAGDPNRSDLRLFEFVSRVYTPMGTGRLEGLMASDGVRQRVALYWAEPYMLRENDSFLRCADFILTPEIAYFWIYGRPELVSVPLSLDADEPLLPKVNSAEAVARSALAIMDLNARDSLQMGDFFHHSRNQEGYRHRMLPDDADTSTRDLMAASDVQVLNALPYGREYSKVTRSDGTVLWELRRALDDLPLAGVVIEPVQGVKKGAMKNVFDPNTLGRWTLIPDPYRTYWSLDKACTELTTSAERHVTSRELYGQIGSRLRDDMPARVCRALQRLRLKAALETEDANCIWQATSETVTSFLTDDSSHKYQGLLELGSVSARIAKRYPQRIEEELRPLVRQMVQHIGSDMAPNLDRLMTTMERNNWFLCGELVLDETRRQELVRTETLDALANRLEASRLTRERKPADPCESIPSIRRYLATLDADPVQGTLDMNDVRRILEDGLARQFTGSDSGARHEIAENVVRSIHLIAGEGPFVGDAARLTESVEQYAELYLAVDKAKAPIDTVLATFLALSFCDNSTSQDHELLCSQFGAVCDGLEAQVNETLKTYDLNAVINGEDVSTVFMVYKRIFRQYVDDPLWPAFKFPFTANEQSRLANKLRLRFTDIEPILDGMSLRVRYGGTSPALKDAILRQLHQVTQELLPETAFLRRPSYPGVSCRYRSQFGFTVVISRPLYKEADRAKGEFKAMKYFHLGHRLEKIVQQERIVAGSTQE